MAITEGAAPPDFTLQDTDGNPVSLAQFANQHLVIYFYPRDDTPGCTKEACGFRDLWSDLGAAGIQVIGVSPDDGASHRRFTDKYQLPFPLLSDPDKAMMTAYGAWGEKKMYGKTVTGVIRSTVWVGPDGLVAKHWKRVPRAADHPARVLAAVTGA